MAAQQQLRALVNDRNLRRFVVQARPTGRQLGTGSYGTVEEVELNGLVCAGKKIHEILLDIGNVGVREIAARYVQECQLMSDLRHPNITLFLGLCFLPNCQLPVLVMERLDGSLDDLLETVPNIPLTLKRSMLEDVARGLLYLHKHDPQIIHRDLTSKNVLLTSSLVAKITDLGNSRIVNIQPGQLAQTLSRNPGTLVYMPPEALSAAARYGPSLDIFSFGHLGIFVGLQAFPGDLFEPTYMDPEDRHRLIARSEVERRRQYIGQLESKLPSGEHHPFVQLMKRCLHNDPSERPTSEELMTSLEEMKADIEGPYGEVARIDAVRQVVTTRALRKRETEVREKTDESAAKDQEIHQLQQELEHEQAERVRAEEHLQQKDDRIQQQMVELQQKDTELNSVQESLQRLYTDLESREAQLRVQEEEMKQRDAEISRLIGELRRCQAQLQRQQEKVSAIEQDPLQFRVGQQIKQTSLVELEIPLKLKWKRGENMPISMGSCQAVVIGDKVYVGEHRSIFYPPSCTVMMVYNIHTGTWGELPRYGSEYVGVAAVNNQLVLVGGRDVLSGRPTNVLGVWDEGSQTWTHPFPEMSTPQWYSSVVSYQRWVVVAGGDDGRGSYQKKVELLDTHSRQWYEGSPLPDECSQNLMSSTINGNMWFLTSGYTFHQENKRVFSVCLDELISQAVLSSTGVISSPSTPSPWQTLTDTPSTNSTLLILNGALLSVGGYKSSAIYLYQPSSRSWVKVSDMPAKLSQCACVVLPSGEIFLAGGLDDFSQLYGSDTNGVYIATTV